MTIAATPSAAWPESISLRTVVVATCALLSTSAAVVHFAVTGEHWEEWWAYGLFFGVAAWFQLAWAVAAVWRPSRQILLVGAIVSLAIAAVWLASRTSGLPFGPESGEAEPASFADALATSFELLLALAAVVVVLRRGGWLVLRPKPAVVMLALVTASLVVLTTIALIRAPGSHGEEVQDAGSHGKHHASPHAPSRTRG